jgi:outer membrane lipoprotein-sorting protein
MLKKYRSLALGAVLFILCPCFLATQGKSAQDSLSTILDKSAEYCRKLAESALYFVCEEKISEEIYDLSGAGSAIMVMSDGQSVTTFSSAPLRRKTTKNSYVYDYQLTKKGDRIEETRTLVEENNRKKNLKDAPLKTQRFISRKAVFGPVGFLAGEWHEVYDYRLIKQDRVEGRDAYVIEAKPKVPIEGKPNYGKLWVDKKDFSVLKIEVEDQSLAGFEKIVDLAKRRGVKPAFTTVHEYGILKNGLRFPSRTHFNEKYAGDTAPGFTQSKTEISYANYRFFTVETRVIY